MEELNIFQGDTVLVKASPRSKDVVINHPIRLYLGVDLADVKRYNVLNSHSCRNPYIW